MASIEYDKDGNARSFNGPEAVDVFAMAVIASGLRMYARCGMYPTRAYTPGNMMRAAKAHLGEAGKGLKARDYEKAADLLSLKVQAEKERLSK
jgi:hypothetical protein